MSRRQTFIDRDIFAELLSEVETARGAAYQDVETVYGDMSRLVVAWLADASPETISQTYNDLGWGGNANARAMHEVAKHWMAKNRAQPDGE